MPIDTRRLDDALDRVHALEARLDLSQQEIESDARRMTGLYGAGGRIPTSGQVVKAEREQGWKQALASRGGKIPGPSQMRQRAQAPGREGAGNGVPCGESHISAGKECHKGGSAAPPAERPARVFPERDEPGSLDKWLEGKVAQEQGMEEERQAKKEIQASRGPNQLGARLRKHYSKGVQVREAGGRLIVSGLRQGEENEMSVMEQAGLYAARKGLRVVRE